MNRLLLWLIFLIIKRLLASRSYPLHFFSNIPFIFLFFQDFSDKASLTFSFPFCFCQITCVAWGTQVHRLAKAAETAEKDHGIDVEIIDLQTVLPWDVDTLQESVEKTGRLLISHEAPLTGGFAGEIAATMQQRCFYHLRAPIKRVCGYDTPFPLVYEHFYIPNEHKVLDGIKDVMNSSA